MDEGSGSSPQDEVQSLVGGQPLTRREREILALLAVGLNSREIAERLTLTNNSVRWYSEQIYRKLGVHDKKQAIQLGQELGLVKRAVHTPLPSTLQARVEKPQHNLPRQITHFYGREGDIRSIETILEDHPLVTLTGSGGVGKTRLALQVAEAVFGGFKDGAWLVDLAPLIDSAFVPQQVAITLGMRVNPGSPILDSLSSFLRSRQALLVLDNCEHLLLACAYLVEALLQASPGLKILATSREPLGISGEAVFPVPSLSVPDPDKPADLAKLDDFASVNLFIDRARLARPGFQATGENAADLARLCQRLDGIPLALELAAARLNILTIGQLVERLDDVFHLLTSGSRTALPRRQTLRAALDWSFDLLVENERCLLPRLSVFTGGCTLQAIEAACSGEGLNSRDVLTTLASLVNKSMVVADRQPGGETRYRLLMIVQQYAQEKLADTIDSDQWRRRHLAYFLSFAEATAPKLLTKDWLTWRGIIENDHENIRQALDFSFHLVEDSDSWPRLILAMYSFWDWNHITEAYEWFNRGEEFFRNHPGFSSIQYAHFLGIASASLYFNNPPRALNFAKRAAEISRSLKDEDKWSHMVNLGLVIWTGMYDRIDVSAALEAYAEAQALVNEVIHADLSEETTLVFKTEITFRKILVSNRMGRYQETIEAASENIRQHTQLGRLSFSIWPLIFWAEALYHLGEYAPSRQRYLQALRLADEYNDTRQSFILGHLGWVDYLEGNLERAMAYCQEGLLLAFETNDRNNLADCLGKIASIMAKRGHIIGAVRVSGASRAFYEQQNRAPFDASLDTFLPGWQDRPDQAEIVKSYEAGRLMSETEAVDFALKG